MTDEEKAHKSCYEQIIKNDGKKLILLDELKEAYLDGLAEGRKEGYAQGEQMLMANGEVVKKGFLDNLEKENARLREYAKFLQDTYCGIYRELAELKKENARLSNSVTELTNSKTELENKVTELEKEIDLYKSLDSHWDEIEEDAKIIAEENAGLKEKLNAWEYGSPIRELETEISELKKDKEWLDNTNNEQTEVILKLNEQIEKMKGCGNCGKQLKNVVCVRCKNNSEWELAE